MRKSNNFQFLVDEDLHRDIALAVREAGHSVRFVPKGFKNGAVLRLAISSRLSLLTGDSDFTNSLLYPPEETKGIVVIKVHPKDPKTVLPILIPFLDATRPKKIKGKLAVVEKNGVRIE